MRLKQSKEQIAESNYHWQKLLISFINAKQFFTRYFILILDLSNSLLKSRGLKWRSVLNMKIESQHPLQIRTLINDYNVINYMSHHNIEE